MLALTYIYVFGPNELQHLCCVQVYWEVRGVNVENSDLQPFEGSTILEEGQREGQINIQVLPDSVPELTETFTLVLLRVAGGAEIDKQFNTSEFSIR